MGLVRLSGDVYKGGTGLLAYSPVLDLKTVFAVIGVTWWRSCLRHCAASRKVACSIPEGVIVEFFIDVILLAAVWPWGRLSL